MLSYQRSRHLAILTAISNLTTLAIKSESSDEHSWKNVEAAGINNNNITRVDMDGFVQLNQYNVPDNYIHDDYSCSVEESNLFQGRETFVAIPPQRKQNHIDSRSLNHSSSIIYEDDELFVIVSKRKKQSDNEG